MGKRIGIIKQLVRELEPTANIKNIRKLAHERYPDTSLGRIIHTPIKKLVEKGILTKDVIGCYHITAEIPAPIVSPEEKETEESELHTKYRNRPQIVIELLKAIEDGKDRPTKLMYNTMLSHYQLKKFVQLMQTNGLILTVEEKDEENGRPRLQYKLTRKGYEFIEGAKVFGDFNLDFH